MLRFTEKLEPAFSTIEVRSERGAAMETDKAPVMPARSARFGQGVVARNLQGDLAGAVGRHASDARRF